MNQRNLQSRQPLETVTLWLIQHAAHRAPDSLSARLEEEWLADLESRSSALARMRFAVGCCWASEVIVSEYPRSRIAAASSAAAAKGFIALDRNFGYFSLRSGTLFLIAGLHVAFFYGLMSLAQTHSVPVEGPLVNRPIDRPTPPILKPTISAPSLKELTFRLDKDGLRLPPIEIEGAEATKDTIQPLPGVEPLGMPVVPSHEVLRVQGGPGLGFPDPDQFYPPTARHLGEQGVATVRVCVDPNGRLTSKPTTLEGSGSARLDAGALTLAAAASGHYKASTEDGRPVNSCYPYRIRFQIKH